MVTRGVTMVTRGGYFSNQVLVAREVVSHLINLVLIYPQQVLI